MGSTRSGNPPKVSAQFVAFGFHFFLAPSFMAQTFATMDLSLSNTQLYAGCVIEEVSGRLTLMTPKDKAVNLVGRNAKAIVDGLLQEGVQELTLTGSMAIWAYLVVFHVVVHRFKAIYYDDGRPDGCVRIAAHP
jgi:hypothetical protein